MANKEVLLIEPFYGGSHKLLMDFLEQVIKSHGVGYDLITLPAKKWHWKARTSALCVAKTLPNELSYKVLFCSSVLNLAELVALRPELQSIRKIIYFHENQFIYPRQKEQHRDFQYGYNTILSAMVADLIVFNSKYNMDTFLKNVTKHLNKQPDNKVKGLEEELRPKCSVIYFPVEVEPVKPSRTYDVLHIVWPHRWEHDKDPETFFFILRELKCLGLQFKLSVLGQSFEDTNEIFERARNEFSESILNFGRVESKESYLKVLASAHVVLSTARHEFFGVAMVEGVKCGCYPLAPFSLVYPELYPSECLYRSRQELIEKLSKFCKKPLIVKEQLELSPINLDYCNVGVITRQFADLLLTNDLENKIKIS